MICFFDVLDGWNCLVMVVTVIYYFVFLDGFLDCWVVFDYGSECLLMLFIRSWVLVVVYLFCLFENGFGFAVNSWVTD